jgi:hypothetical protein
MDFIDAQVAIDGSGDSDLSPICLRVRSSPEISNGLISGDRK